MCPKSVFFAEEKFAKCLGTWPPSSHESASVRNPIDKQLRHTFRSSWCRANNLRPPFGGLKCLFIVQKLYSVKLFFIKYQRPSQGSVEVKSSFSLYINMHFRILIMIGTSGFLTARECTKFVFGRGSAPGPAGAAYSPPLDFLAGFRSHTSKGGEEETKHREREGKERKGMEQN